MRKPKMTLEELKVRLHIKDNEHDDYLQVLLDDAIEFVITWTNNQFAGGFPNDVKRAVSQLVIYQKQMDDAMLNGGDWSNEGGSTTQGGELKSVKIDGLQETYSTASETNAAKFGSWESLMNLPNGPFSILKLHRKIKMRNVRGRRKCNGI